jgi:hypothetical protein|nr:MAG TPA: hypothetical protein [Caudoviricetes sp.]
MAYKLAEEDKLCGVIYPTYEGFKPIPKATCEMLESKCDELDIEINCGGKKVEKPSESQSASNSVSQSNSTSTSTSASNSTSESKSESTSTSESTSNSESTSTSESVTGSVTTSESTSVSESESSSNTGSEVTSDDTIRRDMEKLLTSLNLGNLNTSQVGDVYDKLSGLQSLKDEISRFKDKHNDYVIDYTLTDPEKEPKASTDNSNEYKHYIKLVATKEGKSTEVSGYLPYTNTQWDII